MISRPRLFAALGLVLLLAGALFAFGNPRLTLLNAGLRVEYPWPRGLGALGAAAGLSLVAWTRRARWAIVALGVCAFVTAMVGVDRLIYRLDADGSGLASRGMFGPTVVRWSEVTQVQSGPEVIVVTGAAQSQIRIDTSDFEPQQRASLDRTIARRVREGGGAGDAGPVVR